MYFEEKVKRDRCKTTSGTWADKLYVGVCLHTLQLLIVVTTKWIGLSQNSLCG